MPIHQNWNASGRRIGFNELPTQHRQGSKLVFCQLAWWAAWKPGLSEYASPGQPCHADCPVARDHKAPKALVPLFYPELNSQLCKRKTKNRGNAGWAVSTRPCNSQPNFILNFASSAVGLLIFLYFLPSPLFFIPHWERTYFFKNPCFILKRRKFSNFFPPTLGISCGTKGLSLNQFYSAHSSSVRPLCCLSSPNKMEPRCSAAFQALYAEERRTWPIFLCSARETWTAPLRGGII